MNLHGGAQGECVGRFAPSPSGRMHLGNLWSAVLGWLCVKARGGRMLLRMEDLDPDRCRREYACALMDDLRWLGLTWDNETILWQSERTGEYARRFALLREKGLLYPCFCTRAERLAASAPHRADGQAVYPGLCRGLTPEQRRERAALRRPAWRILVPEETIGYTDGCRGYYEENLSADCGDFILRRSDGVYAYQLAVVVDDGEMGVNFVVRGSDLLSSTPRQIYLQRLLDLPVPAYFHVPLLLAEDGRRLSKRDGDLDMGVLRSLFTPEELLGKLAALAGLTETSEAISLPELLSIFQEDKIPRRDITVPAGYLRKK